MTQIEIGSRSKGNFSGELNSSAAAAKPRVSLQPWFRWFQLTCGILCMAMIANLQYGWTLFVDPIDAKFHWGRAAIQLSFIIFVVTETWLVPVEAWFVDRFGPKVVVAFGGLGIAAGWMLNSRADSIVLLYAGAVISGIGASAIWSTTMGNALKWFPDRRGLAAGLTIAGFGAGAAVTIVPIARTIASSGFEAAFFWFGMGQGLVVLVLSLFLQPPAKGQTFAGPVKIIQSKTESSPLQTLRSPLFWLMYVMFMMVASCGLMAISQLAPFALDLKIANVPVSPFGLQMTVLTLAISLDRILDGIGRPLFGYVSDFLGRENTMFIAFTIGAVALATIAEFGAHPIVFLVMTPLFFLVYGEIYTLFPSICTDMFGVKFATTKAGMLYTAKGTVALIVPLASVIASTLGWNAVFLLAAGLNFTAAVLAVVALKPLRRRHLTAVRWSADPAPLRATTNI
jgi:OFA family oxalate/formate antiporter-like MFS transporter